MLRATPRLPEDDSMITEPGVRTPSRSAASTISVAAFSFTETAKLKPSHFRNSGCPKTASRSMNSSSVLNCCGADITVTTASPPRRSGSAVPAELVEEVRDDGQPTGVPNLVVDVLAHREIEHAEAEGREHHRPVGRQPQPVAQH